MSRTALPDHPFATVSESGCVSSDMHLPVAPRDDERMVFRARGVAFRLHPQDEGLKLSLTINADGWDEWQALVEQVLDLHRRHGVRLTVAVWNSCRTDIGHAQRREVSFWPPLSPSMKDVPLTPELQRTAWALAYVVDVQGS